MNAGNTKQTHWKLIEAREGKPGDQYFHKEWTDVKEGMNLTGLMVRRAMTRAEIHADEILNGLKGMYGWNSHETDERIMALIQLAGHEFSLDEQLKINKTEHA